MPAARDESAEQTLLPCRVFEMKRLRIELGGELDDLGRVDGVPCGDETIADLEVFQVAWRMGFGEMLYKVWILKSIFIKNKGLLKF